jgi:carboxypeptidase Taq
LCSQILPEYVLNTDKTPFSSPAILELNHKFSTQWALGSAESLLSWDLEVNMPPKGSVARGLASAEIGLLTQKQMTEIYPLLDKAGSGRTDYNEYEMGVVRMLERRRKFFTKIPPSLIERERKLASEATVIWRGARKKSNFKEFLPYLEKTIELKREEAEKLGYEGHPYNALLDQFEEDTTVEDMDRMFSKLTPALKSILAKVQNSKYTVESPLVEMSYQEDEMTKINRKLLDMLGMPKEKFRMDISTHPFSSSMSRDDVRITTRYEGTDFRATMFSVIHESGHAIYELQLNDRLEYSPIGVAISYGFHESQSRFWENIIGRSKEFVALIGPLLRENLSFVTPFSDEQLYYYFNYVRPGLIRVEADELTYNFHIALRYQLEKKVIGGEVSASELPQMWNDMMEEYLGVIPSNDAEGVLQDVHWSHGEFGYFATYSLGNVIAGMIWHNMRKELSLEDKVRTGDFGPIKNWLYEKIHRWGATYPPKELAQKAFGESITPDRLIEYLKWKYE